MSDVGEVRKGLLGQGSIYSLALLSPVIASLAITPILTRQLTPVDYGAIALALSITAFGSILATGGLNLSITRNALIGEDGLRGAAGQVLVGSVVAVLLGALAVATLPLWAAAVISTDSISLLVPPVVSSVALAIVTLVQSLLRAVSRVRTFVVLSLASALVGPGVGVVYLSFLGESPVVYLWLVVMGQSLAVLAALFILFTIAHPSVTRKSIRNAYAIALPTVPHQVSTNLLMLGIVGIAGAVNGLEEAGRVQLTLLLGTAPITVLGAVNNAWGPLVYRADANDRSKIVSSAAQLVSWLTVLMVSAYLLMLPWFADLIGGEVLSGSSDLQAISIAVVAVAFMVAYLANIHLVIAQGNTFWLAFTTPTSVAFTLLALYFFADSAGEPVLLAFALALPIFHLIQSVFSYLLRKNSGAEPWDQRVLILPVALIIAACVAWAAVIDSSRLEWIVPIVVAAIALVRAIFLTRRRTGDGQPLKADSNA